MQSVLPFQHICAPIQPCKQSAAGRALPAMADDQPPRPPQPWKRRVAPLGPNWMVASVQRLEETRAETMDSARKRQREAEAPQDMEMAGDGTPAPAAASSSSGLQTALPSSESLPPPVTEDTRSFRHNSLTTASFASTSGQRSKTLTPPILARNGRSGAATLARRSGRRGCSAASRRGCRRGTGSGLSRRLSVCSCMGSQRI